MAQHPASKPYLCGTAVERDHADEMYGGSSRTIMLEIDATETNDGDPVLARGSEDCLAFCLLYLAQDGDTLVALTILEGNGASLGPNPAAVRTAEFRMTKLLSQGSWCQQADEKGIALEPWAVPQLSSCNQDSSPQEALPCNNGSQGSRGAKDSTLARECRERGCIALVVSTNSVRPADVTTPPSWASSLAALLPPACRLFVLHGQQPLIVLPGSLGDPECPTTSSPRPGQGVAGAGAPSFTLPEASSWRVKEEAGTPGELPLGKSFPGLLHPSSLSPSQGHPKRLSPGRIAAAVGGTAMNAATPVASAAAAAGWTPGLGAATGMPLLRQLTTSKGSPRGEVSSRPCTPMSPPSVPRRTEGGDVGVRSSGGSVPSVSDESPGTILSPAGSVSSSSFSSSSSSQPAPLQICSTSSTSSSATSPRSSSPSSCSPKHHHSTLTPPFPPSLPPLLPALLPAAAVPSEGQGPLLSPKVGVSPRGGSPPGSFGASVPSRQPPPLSATSSLPSLLPSRQPFTPIPLVRLFTKQEILAATSNFSSSLRIAEGACGQVYRGQLASGYLVAVKTLRIPSLPSTPGSLARGARGGGGAGEAAREGLRRQILTEISFLDRLHHRNILELLGAYVGKQHVALVFPFAPNGSLQGRLQDASLPALTLDQRLHILLGAAEGLHYLHDLAPKTLIHRDIKSANILLGPNLEPKLCDFGLAKESLLDLSGVTCSSVFGTFGYIAPEYAEKCRVTKKSDMFSFGVVMFEVLSSRPAVNQKARAEDAEERVLSTWAPRMALEGKYEALASPRLCASSFTPRQWLQLRAIAMCAALCCAQDPADRPDAREVVAALQEALLLGR